jgi:signal transduction histidine kinase
MGLLNMSDRLAALGGTFDVKSRPGHGTNVVGQIPLP